MAGQGWSWRFGTLQPQQKRAVVSLAQLAAQTILGAKIKLRLSSLTHLPIYL